ncbi:MAG: hypothetical protein BGO57_13300 [Sphingomonadales bacterium 63-6]|nr:MAG: hypothetical protein BGO57_13300 [Sphingomonadales bacterium 63-6]
MRPFRASRRQLDVLRFIRGYQLAHAGISPTLREISQGVGRMNKTGVWRILRALERRGAIRRLYRRPRAIELLVPVAIPRTPEGAPLYLVPFPQRATPRAQA